jgi:DNA polymerase (family 10)
VTNQDVARVFSRLATMLEIEGANPFRVRAYREAARVLDSQAEPVAALAGEPGKLESLAGIGKDLAAKIRDIVATGTTALFEEMRAKVPVEVVELTELQGLGPKRVKTLFEKLGVRNRADLERLAAGGKLRDLPGFGETIERNVLKALATAKQDGGRMLLAAAWPVAHALAEHLRKVRGVEQVEIAGSFRRRRETVGDLDLLATGGAHERVMAALVEHPEVADVLGRGETKSSVRLRNGLQVDLRLVAPESFGAAMLYFTGSKEHNIELRRIAIDKGLSLNEYGLTRGETTVAGRTEEDVYRALDLAWIPPELREMRGEIEWARAGRLPRLIELEDLRGDLHLHTDRTDGRDTIEAMVRGARDRGYAYCAITDHSKALAMARGFDAARVRRSIAEIAAARKQVKGIEVLHGIEVDILADGALDLDDETLGLLDWVIVSLHSRLDMPGPAITERVLKAIERPSVCAMGHPTGRMIGSRGPSSIDLERVFERAAELGVAMEISAQPDRADLNDVNARLAMEMGVPLVIDTDAHSVVHLDFMRYGVFVARRAGIGPDRVLNTLPADRLRAARHSPSSAARPKRPAASKPLPPLVSPAPAARKAARAGRPTAPKRKPAATRKTTGP